jgi:pSer/pThr/pTyr-binding forkhead associated (FHA) protein
MESKTSKEIRNPERNKKELETEKPETQMNLEQRETGKTNWEQCTSIPRSTNRPSDIWLCRSRSVPRAT